MNIHCSICKADYDDAVCTTMCPHERFIDDETARQKDLACSLVGKDICFNHQPDGPFHRITYVTYDGMVGLQDMVGEFAPHLFKVKSHA